VHMKEEEDRGSMFFSLDQWRCMKKLWWCRKKHLPFNDKVERTNWYYQGRIFCFMQFLVALCQFLHTNPSFSRIPFLSLVVLFGSCLLDRDTCLLVWHALMRFNREALVEVLMI